MLLIKTEAGQQAFKQRSPLFSARQRSAFILFDGLKTLEQVMAATTGLGLTSADVDHMREHGLLALATNPSSSVAAEKIAVANPAAVSPSSLGPNERYQAAKPLATQLVAGLGLRGFMLNLSVESVAGYDELLALFPKIQDAVGAKACRELEIVLKG
jgi:hypothetical protein